MRVAIVSAKGLGDGLLSMLFSHNFSLSGHEVTTFSSPLTGLKRWFQGKCIVPHPSHDDIPRLFTDFDLIVSQDHSCLAHLAGQSEKLVVANSALLDKEQTLAENFVRLCKERLTLPYYEKANGLTPPSELTFRLHGNRVVLHPFSTSPKREWPLQRFIQLSHALKKRGYDVVFTTSPEERGRILLSYPEEECPQFNSLDEMATYLYESGYLIGNNSGPGHLASNFGLPTLSLFARRSYAKLWRPCFTLGRVVTPLPFAFGSRQKEKSLQTLLPVAKVLSHFCKIAQK